MTDSNKQQHYSGLVQQRKLCKVCHGLINPATCDGGQYDSSQIGPWSRWQGDLETKLMVVGQDWGDTNYFLKWKGFDAPKNPANQNLMKLLSSIGINIKPFVGIDQIGELFLTNAILCLKQNGMQGAVDDAWFQNCGKRFLKPLIEIVSPKVVVAVGKQAFKAILGAYDIPYTWPSKYETVVISEGKAGGKKLPGGISLFPVYHCGSRVINMTRNMDAQKNDWKPVKLAL